MGNFLLYDQKAGIVTLTMNQPEVRNALIGNSAIEEFIAACDRIYADSSVRVVVLTGADPAFCSGGNIKEMRRFISNKNDSAHIREWYRRGIQKLTLAVFNLEVPIVAAVNGPAVGAGCDLTCMCDIRIASERASFAESFVKLGIVPGDGGAWLLPRVVGMSKAAEMSYTGDTLNAMEALECGLVSQVVPHERLLEVANSIATRVAANPGNVLRMTKRLLREGQHTRLESILELSAAFQAIAHKSKQHSEAVEAFIARRPPNFSDE